MFWNKNKGRYIIQVLLTGETEWKPFYSAQAYRHMQSALTELYGWRDYKWDFVADKPRFRIYDTRLDKVVDDYEKRSMRELGVEI